MIFLSDIIIEHFVRDKDCVLLKHMFPNELWPKALLLTAKGPKFFWNQDERVRLRETLRAAKDQNLINGLLPPNPRR